MKNSRQICSWPAADPLLIEYEDVVLDIGAGDKIVGIEILEASAHVDLGKILPIQHEGIKVSA